MSLKREGLFWNGKQLGYEDFPGRHCLSDTWKGRICCRNLLHHQILSKLVSVLFFHIWLIHKKNNADFKNKNPDFFFFNLWEKDISPPVFQLFPGGPWITRDLSGLARSPPDHCVKVSASSIAVVSKLIFPCLVCLKLLTAVLPPHPAPTLCASGSFFSY